MNLRKLLVISDLDACFMDENYQYDASLEAVSKLANRDFPLVFNSSKTLPELLHLTGELKLDTPVVAENGGYLAVPVGSPLAVLCESHQQNGWKLTDQHWTRVLGLPRYFILEEAHYLRAEQHYQFKGFDDWTVAELAELTGLSLKAAEWAKDRRVSEPILWQDSQERWQAFEQSLRQHDIRALHGGRFIHLMGSTDKVDGLTMIRDLYQDSEPTTDWTTVALGDSPNDLRMLEAADIGVVIPHGDEARIQTNGEHIRYADMPASEGWNQSILDLLDSF